MTTLEKMMNYTNTMAIVNKAGDNTVNMMFSDLCITIATLYGDKYTVVDMKGKRENDGMVLQGYDADGKVISYFEIWNNSDMRTPNIAFRPFPTITKELGLTLDNNGIEGVKYSHPKRDITDRFAVSIKAVVAFTDLITEKSIALLDRQKEEHAKRLDAKIKECQAAAEKYVAAKQTA